MEHHFFGTSGAREKERKASLLQEKYSLPTCRTGDILEGRIKNENPCWIKAKSFIDTVIVPDEVGVEIVAGRQLRKMLNIKSGCIFDGPFQELGLPILVSSILF